MRLNSDILKKFKLYNVVTFEEYRSEHKSELADRHSTSLSSITPKKVEWLWLNRFPLGKLSIISGDPGLGKSILTSYLAAQVTQGKPFPDELCPYGQTKEKGSVIMLSAEDDISDTLVPRLKAAGADLDKVRAMDTVIHEGKKHRGLDITKDILRIEEVIEGFQDCKLITIDPISSFLGRVDSNSNSEVRGALAPLTDLAQKHGIAVVCISHLNKGAGKAMYRTMGSLAFVAAARTAFAIAKDENDDDLRYFCEIKNNLAKNCSALSYEVAYSQDHHAPYLIWDKTPVNKTTEEIMSQGSPSDLRNKEIMRNVITKFLKSGPKTADEVREEFEKHNLSLDSLRRHKKEFGVESYRPRGGHGSWYWRLCNGQ